MVHGCARPLFGVEIPRNYGIRGGVGRWISGEPAGLCRTEEAGWWLSGCNSVASVKFDEFRKTIAIRLVKWLRWRIRSCGLAHGSTLVVP